VTVPAPLDELPLFVHAGAVLALLPADVQTLTDYGTGVVHLGDRSRELRLLAFPRGRTRTSLGPGESVRSVVGKTGWRLRFTGKRRRLYRLQASLGVLERPYRPCAVRIGSHRTLSRKAWRYDRATRVLTAGLRLRSGTLTFARRCRRR